MSVYGNSELKQQRQGFKGCAAAMGTAMGCAQKGIRGKAAASLSTARKRIANTPAEDKRKATSHDSMHMQQ